jgi:molybdopterin synthase sulfur carrier subunit
MTSTIRVVLPAHLKALARISGEVQVDIDPPVTQRTVLDAIEARYPTLAGTVRDHTTQQRRPFVRFYACQEDLSHDSPDDVLPDAVVNGTEPFLIIGSMAGG